MTKHRILTNNLATCPADVFHWLCDMRPKHVHWLIRQRTRWRLLRKRWPDVYSSPVCWISHMVAKRKFSCADYVSLSPDDKHTAQPWGHMKESHLEGGHPRGTENRSTIPGRIMHPEHCKWQRESNIETSCSCLRPPTERYGCLMMMMMTRLLR